MKLDDATHVHHRDAVRFRVTVMVAIGYAVHGKVCYQLIKKNA